MSLPICCQNPPSDKNWAIPGNKSFVTRDLHGRYVITQFKSGCTTVQVQGQHPRPQDGLQNES